MINPEQLDEQLEPWGKDYSGRDLEGLIGLPPGGKPLSGRLWQVLRCLVAGHSEKQIAIVLEISEHTVHVYVKDLYRAYAVHTRAELLRQVLKGALRTRASHGNAG